jgi:hypothetical protein
MSECRFKVNGYYKWTNSIWSRDPNCFPPSVIKNILENNTFYITDMSRCTEKINQFSKKIEETYKIPVDAHIYVCRNINVEHPFGIHFDYSDNIIVQCEGKTNFKVWDLIQDKNQRSHLLMENPPILDVILSPGDAITIPAFYPHLATSVTKRLSISFPIPKLQPHEKLFEEREWIKIEE